MKITIVAGARPNFMKIAPIIESIIKHKKLTYRLVHTGQHYDKSMSDTFFEELDIPYPDVNLSCGGGSQAEQAASIMVAFEKDLISHPTDLVLVVGDVTSTMACSIVAKKLNTKVAHVEAGIRSNDMTMPEEINRIVTDSLADYFFTTTRLASQNLYNTGVNKNIVYFVGNVMIDTLLKNYSRLRKPLFFDEYGLVPNEYIILTLHRPANVDDKNKFEVLLTEITKNSKNIPIIFPVHPRTAKIFSEIKFECKNLHLVQPLGYLEFNYLVLNAKAVITDSGGITEETTVMGVPCLTLRDNTERPETCEIGTNELIGTNPKAIKPALEKLFANKWKKGNIPDLWDGNSAERIVAIITEVFN
ncbi:MAG: non-hydrolyzing UDP-N-acetylglucosamine 2-epimerase [Paludibacter sp.]